MDQPSKYRPLHWRSKSAKQLRFERFSSDNDKSASSSGGLNSLEDFGFVSKGDERLKDFVNQEQYHKYISAKYLEFCATAGGPENLEVEFAHLAVTPLNHPPTRNTSAPPKPSINVVYNDARNAELTGILLCMRKLREGLTASRRYDKFATGVFKQHIRAAILVQQIDSYHPALLYFLHELRHHTEINHLDVQEFAVYHMLHMAARMEDCAAALSIKNEFSITDRRALQAVNAMIHGNYWSYRAARNRVDQYVGRLMDFAEDRMRKLMLKCVGATYFTVDLGYLEIVGGLPWRRLQEEHGVGWELDQFTKTVTVRKPKLKTDPQRLEHAVAEKRGNAKVDVSFKAWD